MNGRTWRVRAVLAMATCLAALLQPIANAAPSTTVTDAPAGVHDFPFTLGCCYYEFADVGYTLREYFVSGVAKTYTEPSTVAPFTTRVLVALPNDPTKFNGTLVAEWENVTAQAPAQPGMVWLHHYMLPRGYGYMAVSAQLAGVNTMQLWDPVRYASLSHPGDDYSYDIYTQALRAIERSSVQTGHKIKRTIGYGQSQSAGRLNSYVNLAQNDANVVDGMIIQADGGERKSFPGLQIPLIHFETEDSIAATPADPANNSDLYRLWEVVGTAHVGNEETQSPGILTLAAALTVGTRIPWDLDAQYWENSHYGEEGPGVGTTCVGGVEMPMRYALDAALEGMHVWLKTGVPVPQPPRASFDGAGAIQRDEHGNALGGLRLPPIDVPVASYNATTCGLLGSTMPFLPTELLDLYPTHEDYVSKMTAAIEAALQQRIIVQSDADELLRKVQRSLIPLWRPSTQFGLLDGAR